MWLQLLILILAIPVGYLIAYMARDELKSGRKFFHVLIMLAFITAIWAFYTKQIHIIYTCAFVGIISFISLIKSQDKKWIKKI